MPKSNPLTIRLSKPLPQIHENLAILRAYLNSQLHNFRFARNPPGTLRCAERNVTPGRTKSGRR